MNFLLKGALLASFLALFFDKPAYLGNLNQSSPKSCRNQRVAHKQVSKHSVIPTTANKNNAAKTENSTKSSNEEGSIDTYSSEKTNGKIVLELYQLMKDVHEVLVANNIEYWAIAGTLLGAVRHKGIIPHDDDLDICICKKNFSEFAKLEPIFNRLGYDVKHYGLFSKILPQNREYPFIDIFFHIQRGNGIFYGWYNFFKYPREDKSVVIYADELYPLKDYKFGEIFIKGPNDPYKYLECCYGPDCLTVMYYGKSHHKDGKVKKRTLTAADKVCAMPTGPLQDNFKLKILHNQQFTAKTTKISKNNLDEMHSIFNNIKPIYIEAFKDLYKSLSKDSVFSGTKQSIEEILASRFDKIEESVLLQLNSVNGYYVTLLKDGSDHLFGYIIFMDSQISKILESMVSRNYIKSTDSLSTDVLDPQNSPNSDLYVVSIAILPQWQSKGYGKFLTNSTLLECPQAKNIYLLSSESKANIKVQQIYEHLKFERKGVLLTSDNNLKILYAFSR